MGAVAARTCHRSRSSSMVVTVVSLHGHVAGGCWAVPSVGRGHSRRRAVRNRHLYMARVAWQHAAAPTEAFVRLTSCWRKASCGPTSRGGLDARELPAGHRLSQGIRPRFPALPLWGVTGNIWRRAHFGHRRALRVGRLGPRGTSRARRKLGPCDWFRVEGKPLAPHSAPRSSWTWDRQQSVGGDSSSNVID